MLKVAIPSPSASGSRRATASESYSQAVTHRPYFFCSQKKLMPPADPNELETTNLQAAQDSTFATQVEKLHRLTVYGRWALVSVIWLFVGLPSLWALRSDIGLMLAKFTWASLRYTLSLYYSPLPTMGLFLCIGMTTSVLVWQSRNILFGMPAAERNRLEKQVLRIRQQGESHPLWKWICK